jgi:hypothetical protein
MLRKINSNIAGSKAPNIAASKVPTSSRKGAAAPPSRAKQEASLKYYI